MYLKSIVNNFALEHTRLYVQIVICKYYIFTYICLHKGMFKRFSIQLPYLILVYTFAYTHTYVHLLKCQISNSFLYNTLNL